MHRGVSFELKDRNNLCDRDLDGYDEMTYTTTASTFDQIRGLAKMGRTRPHHLACMFPGTTVHT
jgi:hypothetical protein